MDSATRCGACRGGTITRALLWPCSSWPSLMGRRRCRIWQYCAGSRPFLPRRPPRRRCGGRSIGSARPSCGPAYRRCPGPDGSVGIGAGPLADRDRHRRHHRDLPLGQTTRGRHLEAVLRVPSAAGHRRRTTGGPRSTGPPGQRRIEHRSRSRRGPGVGDRRPAPSGTGPGTTGMTPPMR